MVIMRKRVILVSHNPNWTDAFETETRLITQALGEIVVAQHHIGSTAIPMIHAKPIIDILLEVDDIVHLDEHTSKMESIGYEAMGEYGIPGRRYFRKSNSKGTRTHHVHAFDTGSYGAWRLLAFRDYMIAHPHFAKEYDELKLDLASQFPEDGVAYQEGKDTFIKDIQQKALIWKSGGVRPFS